MSIRRSSWWQGLFAVTLTAAVGLWAVPARADVEVDLSVFYDGLAPYGQWTNHVDLGWVWFPVGVRPGWRPYVDGRWIYTDDYGWVWDSDYEWGWAPFHYGRWFHDRAEGWLWLPGSEWGPAWVTWRVGAGYVGWAPLPPAVTWSVSTGFGWGGFDSHALTFSPAWTFVEERRFADPRLREHTVALTRNIELVRMTRDTTNLTVASGRVRNHSVDVAQVERAVGRAIPHATVREVETVEATRFHNRRTGDVSLFRPAVTPSRPAQAPPAAARGSRATDHGQPAARGPGPATTRGAHQRGEPGEPAVAPPAARRPPPAATAAPDGQPAGDPRAAKRKPKRAGRQPSRP